MTQDIIEKITNRVKILTIEKDVCLSRYSNAENDFVKSIIELQVMFFGMEINFLKSLLPPTHQ